MSQPEGQPRSQGSPASASSSRGMRHFHQCPSSSSRPGQWIVAARNRPSSSRSLGCQTDWTRGGKRGQTRASAVRHQMSLASSGAHHEQPSSTPATSSAQRASSEWNVHGCPPAQRSAPAETRAAWTAFCSSVVKGIPSTGPCVRSMPRLSQRRQLLRWPIQSGVSDEERQEAPG